MFEMPTQKLPEELFAKLQHLQEIIQKYDRVAVAFSGGTDSSFLLKMTLDILDRERVIAFFARSSLLKKPEIDRAQQWYRANGVIDNSWFHVVDVDAFQHVEFTENTATRCYVCKHRMYSRFLELMKEKGIAVLIDGTNASDIHRDRPGLRAIAELGIQTPLVQADISKQEVRIMGEYLGLSNWAHPASSCLATRIPKGIPITEKLLRRIEMLEQIVEAFGLVDFRLYMDDASEKNYCLYVDAAGFVAVIKDDLMARIVPQFREHNVENLRISLKHKSV